MLANKSILITGGTGSFGKALTKEMLTKYPTIKQIIIYSRNEQKQYEMAQEVLNWRFDNLISMNITTKIRFVIGDIRDVKHLKNTCKNKGQNIDIIIHAAALKHIDLAENNPLECIKTNIGGAENVIEVAQDLNIQTVIAISTDKACSPTSIYGASKLCADKLFVDANNQFSIIRYANFFASAGSVVPFFQKEKEKSILPITHIETTRFSLTMKEATTIALDILEKSLKNLEKKSTENLTGNLTENSFGGEIFVPKLRSYKITDLATTIAPKATLNIIGLRQGEKIHEEMLNETEANCAFETEKYYIIVPKKQLLESYRKHYEGKKISVNFALISNQNHAWITQNELLEMIENI